MLAVSFLTRLVAGDVELKSCMETDASAAQSDLRHLNVYQLLTVRINAFDLTSESGSHSSRISFLSTVDRHLFERITRTCLRGTTPPPQKPEALHALGIRVALMVGASELIAGGWGGIQTGAPDLPPYWLVQLAEEQWPQGNQAAVFHDAELWLEALPEGEAATPAIAELCEGPIAVLKDRTSGVGKDRMLHWEVSVVNPREEDALAVLNEVSQPDPKQTNLNRELTAVLKQRTSFLEGGDHRHLPPRNVTTTTF